MKEWNKWPHKYEGLFAFYASLKLRQTKERKQKCIEKYQNISYSIQWMRYKALHKKNAFFSFTTKKKILINNLILN